MSQRDWIEGALVTDNGTIYAPKLSQVVAALRESRPRVGADDPSLPSPPAVSLTSREVRSIDVPQITLNATRLPDATFKADYVEYRTFFNQNYKPVATRKTRVCLEALLTLDMVIDMFTSYFWGGSEWLEKYTWGDEEGSALPLAEPEAATEVTWEAIDGKRSGVVYLLRSGPWWKIGKSRNSEARMRQLKIQLPEKADLVHEIETDDVDRLERHWHAYFGDKRGNGEWFKLDEADVLEFRAYKRIETE